MFLRSAVGTPANRASGEPIQQLGVGVVGERVFAVRARLAGVEIGVGQIEAARADRVERRAIALARVLEAREKQRLGFRASAP